jgi:uncharacterized protein YjbI with pentapeptide repeats
MDGKVSLRYIVENMLYGADLRRARMPYFAIPFYTDSEPISFIGTNFTEANLSFMGIEKNNRNITMPQEQYIFDGANLNKATLDHGKLVVSFSECNLNRTNFYKCFISQATFEECDMRYSNFKKTIIDYCTFESCLLTHANFVGSKIIQGRFDDCNLYGVNFQKATFFTEYEGNRAPITFMNCSFMDANFKNVDLTDCKFVECDLTGIHLENATLTNTLFDKCNIEVLDSRIDLGSAIVKSLSEEEKEWTDADHDLCDNAIVDGVKEDVISGEALKRGKGMVVVRKYDPESGKELELPPHCYNRDSLKTWFDTQKRNGTKFQDPLNRQRIKPQFFDENGGFSSYYREGINGGKMNGKGKMTRRKSRRGGGKKGK